MHLLCTSASFEKACGHITFYLSMCICFLTWAVQSDWGCLLPQFLTIEPRFVRKSKGCAGQVEIAILPQFLAIEPHFVRKGCAGRLELALLSQFLTIEPPFARKGCVSCRLVVTAPAPAFRREIEKKEKARGRGKRARGQEEKM